MQTTTFLFSDIEGSTRLWEAHPDAMAIALARHDFLMRQSLAFAGGMVFKTVGDAFCAAFGSPVDALRAAQSVQRQLADEPWPDAAALRVRIAIHTGVAEERDGDYFGPTLNRTARLLAIGHGGQTLVSLAAAEIARDLLPAAAALRPLGSHRLKDLTRSEVVYQLDTPGHDSVFPPLRSLDRLPHNLPLQLTSFVGREAEQEQIARLLEESRIVTLTGSGGCGKTRLALQVGAEVLDRYPDGAWWVEFAGLTDPGQIVGAIAEAVGFGTSDGDVPALLRALEDRRCLILLDNCEHLVEAVSRIASDIVRTCPGVDLLTTSREPLATDGETLFRIPSLTLPDRDPRPPLETLSQYAAVQLFLERARAVQGAFTIDERTAPAVAEICHRLDGIPLAIELAAARLRSLGVHDLIHRLEDRFRILTGGNRSSLPRQQTLRALIDWSYNLLSSPEQTLLNRLAVFPAGFRLGAAEAIVADHQVPEGDVLDLLTSLVDKSLILFHEPTARYRLLETIREYASEKAGDLRPFRDNHARWFRHESERAFSAFVRRGESELSQRLIADVENLRAAIHWALGEGDGATALILASHPRHVWWTGGRGKDGRDLIERALALAPDPSVDRAYALTSLGMLYREQGRPDLALTFIETGLEMHRRFDERAGIADALNSLAGCLIESSPDLSEDRFQLSLSWLEEAAAHNQAGGNGPFLGSCLNSMAFNLLMRGQPERAWPFLERALTFPATHDDDLIRSSTLDTAGEYAFQVGDLDRSDAYLREALESSVRQGYSFGIASQIAGLGRNASARGEDVAAVERIAAYSAVCRRHFVEGVKLYHEYAQAALEQSRNALSRSAFDAAWERGWSLANDPLSLFSPQTATTASATPTTLPRHSVSDETAR